MSWMIKRIFKTTHMLVKYAEYANIGGNRTVSYGQINLFDVHKNVGAT
ncbi:MAG: hypothetical protein FWC41_09135 [Firmicutes bacterium]|nr:hypothetical protein [Bacillota bacterium]